MKILKNKKALSPVVASIILIAVTVAVSIAVAAWMGALTMGFMGGGEQLQVGSPWGWNDTRVYVNVTNKGGSPVTLSHAIVSNGSKSEMISGFNVQSATGKTLDPKESAGIRLSGYSGTFTSGYSYTITIVTQDNNEFTTTGTPPG